MKSKSIVEKENTSSAFARSVLIARPKGMVVEVNDEDGQCASVTDGSRFVNPIM